MKTRSRSRAQMEVFCTETGADGEEYQVGCCCDDHSNDTSWIQCTEADCDIWYCEDDIIQRTGASKADLKKFRESPSLFKCEIHGLQDLEFKADEKNESEKTVSVYNFRKRNRRQSLPVAMSDDMDDELATNSFGRRFPKDATTPNKERNKKNNATKKKNNATKKKNNATKKKDTNRLQMDMMRYSTIDSKAIQDAAENIVSIERKLAAYLRDQNKAAELIVIITKNKSKQGRLFGKNRDLAVIGSAGNKSNKWSHPECIVLKVSLLFVSRFGGALRFDGNASPASQSNVNVIHRVYNAMILEEGLDIAYHKEFRERKNKAIKDKLVLCSKLNESEPNGVLLDIRNILVKHLKINQFRKEPSSGQEALQQAQIKELKERNKKMHRKLKATKSDKMDKVLDLLTMNLEQAFDNQQSNKQAMDYDLQSALDDLGNDDSDMEVLPPAINKATETSVEALPPAINTGIKTSVEEKKQSPEHSSIPPRQAPNAASPATFANQDSRTKIYVFIDELTTISNDIIKDEDKQKICLAFYDHSLSADVSAYLDSLLSTRKSLTDIAKNLLWFINCLNQRNNVL